jgi:cytidylate kinase
MNDHLIISLNRTYGSGGRELGALLGTQMGLHVYNKDIVEMAADKSGIRKEYFERVDEKPTDSFLYTLATNALSFASSVNPYDNTLSSEKLFNQQADVIREIADREDCIIIGRCAGHILRDMPRCVRVYMTAGMEYRIQRVMGYEKCDRQQAEKSIKAMDKRRENYFGYYTGKEWDACSTYDLSIDTSVLGLEGAAKLIIDYIKIRFGE